jgi:hypothetical protein
LRIENLILNDATGKPLPPAGLVYVQAPGATMATSHGPDRHPVDADSRGSIAANSNEPFTLFDVPRAAPQSDVYESQTVNPAHCFDAGQRLEIVMEPAKPAGMQRIQDLDLVVSSSHCGTQSLSDLRFALTNRTSSTASSALALNDLLREFTTLCRAEQDPFVVLHVDDAIQIGALEALCLILASIETDHGIRMEPPAAQHLYYRAYMPDDALRDRETRIMQPAEITFTRGSNDVLAVSLLDITEHWQDNSYTPTLTFKAHAVGSPEALLDRLMAIEKELPILLVFVPPTLTHGELMRWLGPLLTTHPTVHVFTPVNPPKPSA